MRYFFKWATTIALLLSAPSVFAKDFLNNFYVGAGPGVGINYFSPDFELFDVKDARHGALGGRFFIGYTINRYIDVELGGTYFGDYHNQGNSSGYICFSDNLRQCIPNQPAIEHLFAENIQVSNTIQSYAIDLTTKWNWPVTQRFVLFAKTGAAYIHATINSLVTIDFELFNHEIGHITQETYASNSGNFWSHINPVLGIGEEYFLTDAVSMRAEYDYYFPVKMHSDIASGSGKYDPSIIIGSVVYHF
jgi:hypothetical protein